MTKERIMIFTITIAVMVGVVFGWFYYTHKPMPNNVTDSVSTEKEKDEQKDEKMEPVQLAPFENARYVTVEKVVRTTTEDTDGNCETVYNTYLVSDIDLKSGIDETEELSKALSGSEYDEEKIKTVSFSENMGFSYKGLSGLEIHNYLLKQEGFDGDLTIVSFDKETYRMTGQRHYVIQSVCSVIDQLMLRDNVDKVLEQKVYFQTTENKNGVVIPDYYVALVRYQQGDKTVEKSVYLQISINNWEEA
ncbi:MAG: hypothetical protein PHX08_06895 [Lachnospiraceae bacterium]|nr:hypothetical protein [Lachnospiraceae bacterium]